MSKLKIFIALFIVYPGLTIAQPSIDFTLNGHIDDIVDAAFSNDAKLVATSSEDSTVCVWDINARKLLGKLTGHAGPVYGSVFSTDKKCLVSVSGDLTVKMWDLISFKCVFTSKPFNDEVKLAAVSPNSKYFAAEDDDEVVKVWDFNTFQMVDSFSHPGSSKSIRFKNDETLIYLEGGDYRERNVITKSVIFYNSGEPQPKYSVTLADWGKGVFEIKNNETGKSLRIDNKGVSTTSYNLEGNWFVFGDEDGNIALYNLTSGGLNSRFKCSDRVQRVHVSPSGRYVISFDCDDFVKLYDLTSGKILSVENMVGTIASGLLHIPFWFFSGDEKYFFFLLNGYLRRLSCEEFKIEYRLDFSRYWHSNSGKYLIHDGENGVSVVEFQTGNFFYHNINRSIDASFLSSNNFFMAVACGKELVLVDLRQLIPDDILTNERNKYFDLAQDITEFETNDDYQKRMKEAKILSEDIKSWYRVKEDVTIDSIGKYDITKSELPVYLKGENVVISIQKEAAKTFKENSQKVKTTGFRVLSEDMKSFRYTDFSFTHPVDGNIYLGLTRGSSNPPPVIADVPEQNKSDEKTTGSPAITMIHPKIEKGGSIEAREKSFALVGEISGTGTVGEIRVNDEKVKLDKSSQFHANLTLKLGSNKIVITANIAGKQVIFDFVVSYRGDSTPPVIAITEPPGARGMKVIRKSEIVKVKGSASDESGVASITVNNKPAKLTANGGFEVELYLEIGDNTVTVEAIDMAGNKGSENLTITRQLEDIIAAGKYYALIIGINDYKGTWTKLKNAVNDAGSIAQMLKSEYKFDQISTLYDAEATRARIISEFERLSKVITPDDNLVIFYSGHGEFKAEFNKGYWVPVDATTNSVAGYISNNDLQTFIAGIKSKHTLLITDACFAGDIFKGNTKQMEFENTEKYYKEVYRKPSRYALTSGDIEPVTDGGTEGHSIFTYFLLKKLRENKSKYFSAFQLFQEIEIPVINSSDQQPKYLPIKNAFDEGGQFIFIRRE